MTPSLSHRSQYLPRSRSILSRRARQWPAADPCLLSHHLPQVVGRVHPGHHTHHYNDISTTNMTLLALFPSTSYALAYALPLFFLSLPVTFAGAFLTLDRTRTFAPRADAGYQITIPGSLQLKAKRRVLRIPLQGGLGGLLGGYLVGSKSVISVDSPRRCSFRRTPVHVSTFLTLLIPGVTTSAALSPKSFIPVWLLSAIITTILGARWRYAALPFYGIAGG